MPAGTASGTWRGSSGAWTTSPTWAPPRCGSRPSTPRPGVDMGYDIADFRGRGPAVRRPGRAGPTGGVGPRARSARAAGPGAVPHLDPPPVVHRASGVLRVGRRRRPAEQLGGQLRRPGLDPDPARGRWYLHSYYPEMPDLDWRNPDVVAAMQDVVRFWLDRGVDGFRLDAIQGLMKDPAHARRPAGRARRSGSPCPRSTGGWTTCTPPTAPTWARRWRRCGRPPATPPWWARCTCPPPTGGRTWSTWTWRSRSSCCTRRGTRARCGRRSQANAGGGAAWVLSNHDFPRVPTRVGEENARAAAVLLLTLPGPAFVYQGEELGQTDAPGPGTRYDRHGRDSCRHPVQWEPDPRTGGFTEGEPWLAPVDAPRAQRARPDRRPGVDARAVPGPDRAARRAWTATWSCWSAGDGVVAFRRGAPHGGREHLLQLPRLCPSRAPWRCRPTRARATPRPWPHTKVAWSVSFGPPGGRESRRGEERDMPARAFAALVSTLIVAFAAGCGGGDERLGLEDHQLVRVQRARRRLRRGRGHLQQAGQGRLQDQASSACPPTPTPSASCWSGGWPPRTPAST